jgi:1-acyl-sn-glycerol-3-phosphate acyltransferase
MTLWHLMLAIGETAAISAPTLVEAARGTLTPEICDARLEHWAKKILSQAKVTYEVAGLENAPRDESFVVMSNHQSLYDIPILFQVLKRRVRMVAKRELFRIPGWSHAMRIAGFVEIDRNDREQAIESLRRAEAALNSGTNIWIAPEGTRSQSGELGPFKKGGFHMALDARVRILPITITGTRNALLARGFNVRNGAHVHVTVHPPVDPSRFGHEGREELIEEVRRAIQSALPRSTVQVPEI